MKVPQILAWVAAWAVVARAGNTGEQAVFLTRLKGEKGWNPLVLVDVGANHGGWSTFARKLWPDAAILMIEADSRHEKQLADTAKAIGNAAFHIGIMADSEREVEFFNGACRLRGCAAPAALGPRTCPQTITWHLLVAFCC